MNCKCKFQKFTQRLPPQIRDEFYCGARLQLQDNGELNEILRYDKCGYKSCSSYDSYTDQFRCSSMNVNILYSTQPEGSWIQLEAYSLYTFPICHLYSYFYLLLYDLQSGPRGHSIQTDRLPVVIDADTWKIIKKNFNK